MAVNYPAKSKAPDLSPTPEELVDSETNGEARYGGGIPHNRSGFNLHLQERLLSYGNYGAPLDNENRMGRRPSVGSLSIDGSSVRDRDSDDGSFNLKRSPSQKSLRSLRRRSAALQRRSYVVGVVSDQARSKAATSLIESFHSLLRRSSLPQHIFLELHSEDVVQAGPGSWPATYLSPDAIIVCKDVSKTTASPDTVATLIDAFKPLACPLFVLLLRSPAPIPNQFTPQTPVGPAVDPLNDPAISRAFSQQTKIRFLRVGSSAEDTQRTLKEILTTLDQEVPQIPPTRARGLSSPAPYTRNNGSSVSVNNITGPIFERRGSEASSRQTQIFSNQKQQIPPPPPQVLFQKARPFHLSLGRERQGGSSPPQSPKTTKPPLPHFLDQQNLSEPISQDYLESRAPFAIPTLPIKFVDPPSPAGTTPSGSRRHSRLLDSESDFASDVVGEPEELMDRWPVDDQEEFARALANLNLTDGGGQTWEELIDRLLNPGIPGEDDDFLTIFLVFYRKFAAPSKFLRSLIAKFEEAKRSAVDYMLQMIVQTRCCDILTRWVLTHPNDFCYPSTHAQARAFIASLDDAFMLAHYSFELLSVMDSIEPNPENDPDRVWGRTDDNPDQARDEEEYDLVKGSRSVPLSPSGGTPSRKRSLARWDFSRKHSIKEEHEAPGRLQHTRDAFPMFSHGNSISISPSELSGPEFTRTPSGSTVSSAVDVKEIFHRSELVRSHSDLPHSSVDLDGVRRYEPFFVGRERKESSASSISSGSGVKENIRRMTAFWDASPEEIAIALTKMEWEYFIALSPREIPRHMWTPDDKRDKDSSMERIVYYFNHVAKWVATTILYSPKLKERVRDMEKMLRVVIELRKLDNYDTLFAVISGLENQSVYRLSKTLEEVKKIDFDQIEDGRKRSQGSIRTGKTGTLWLKYQSCRALMARDRNFSPYRMAFKNSFSSRIPWLSRHKADMLSAAAVNKTFVSPNVIKWSGFQIMGESLLSVLQCQHHPYNFGTRAETLERAILETPDISEQVSHLLDLVDKQELDAKSHELEPPKRSYSKSHSAGSQWISKTFTRR